MGLTDTTTPPPASPPDAPSAGDPAWTYFSPDEQPLQSDFRQWRDRCVAPLVRLCLRCGITADVVSVVALGLLLPFGVGLFALDQPWGAPLACIALALHVLLDGLDGPLARAARTDGPAGAFTDMCFDHTGFLIVATLLACAGRLPGGVATAYASTYTLAIVMVVALNLLGRPLRWVLRTKYVFYLLIALALLGGPDVLTPAAALFSTVHGLFAVAGFMRVRSSLPPRS